MSRLNNKVYELNANVDALRTCQQHTTSSGTILENVGMERRNADGGVAAVDCSSIIGSTTNDKRTMVDGLNYQLPPDGSGELLRIQRGTETEVRHRQRDDSYGRPSCIGWRPSWRVFHQRWQWPSKVAYQ